MGRDTAAAIDGALEEDPLKKDHDEAPPEGSGLG